MQKRPLGLTGIETSQLGFGCVQLTTHRERSEAVTVLEHAFAQGITHFDVARAYGFGRCEGILGEFLRGKRDKVTVATKFGLQPPAGLAGNRWIIDTTKKILRPFPFLLRRAQTHGGTMGKSGAFSQEAAVLSLETSLCELKTDYVDLLLLHEATLADAANEPLISALQQQVSKGKVRCLGIASDFDKLNGDATLLPAAYQVVQFNDNAATRNIPELSHLDQQYIVTHSIFKPAGPLQCAIAANSRICKEFSSRMNIDLSKPEIIGSLLLHYALHSNPGGIVLFSSTNRARITANVQQAETNGYSEMQLEQFTQFVDKILAAQAGPPLQDASIPSSPQIS